MKEIEVKFKLKGPKVIKTKLKKIGAKFIKKVFEENLRFDDKKRRLKSKNFLLRLRKDDKIRLTFKDRKRYFPTINDDGLKVAEEIEIEVGDFKRMKRILEKLGFRVSSRYQKMREIWHYKDLEIAIDKMPYLGYFLEIEGPSKNIKRIVASLKLDLKNGITKTYGNLWEEYRKKHKIRSGDMVFKK